MRSANHRNKRGNYNCINMLHVYDGGNFILRNNVVIILIILCLALPGLASATTPTNSTEFYPEFDVDVWIDGWEWYVVYATDLDSGDTIYVDIEVTSGTGIDFFICDETNYNLWSSGFSATVYRNMESVGSISTSFNVPSSGTGYCVFYNDDILTSNHIEGYVGTTPLIPAGVDIFLVIVGLVFAFVIAGVIWFGLKKMQRPKTVPYPPPQQPYFTQQYPQAGIPSTYCPYCGTPRQSSTASFCATCGRAFEGPNVR